MEGAAVNEEEEFEFRLRLEREQSASPQNSPQATAAPQQRPSTLTIAAEAPAKTVNTLADEVLNTPTRIANLGIAGLGSLATFAGYPGIAPEPMPDPNFVRRTVGYGTKPQGAVQENVDKALQFGTAALIAPGRAASNFALGAASGSAGDVVGRATGSPVAELATNLAAPMALQRGAAGLINPEAAALAARGVKTTSGQSGGPISRGVEAVASKIPLVGSMVANRKNEAIASWNKVKIDEALAPIGEKLPPRFKAGQEAIEDAGNRVGAEYDDVLSSGVAQIDRPLQKGWFNVQNAAQDIGDEALRNKVRVVLKDMVQTKLNATGTITGQSLKETLSVLKSESKRYSQGDYADKKAARVLDEMHDALMDNFGRHSQPETLKRLKAADVAFARLSRIRDAATKGKDGIFSPQNLHDAITSKSAGASKRAEAEGKAFGQKEVESARRVLGANMARGPNALEGTLAGGGLVAPALAGLHIPVAAVAAGAGALYSPWGQAVSRAMRGLPGPASLQHANPYGVTGATAPLSANALNALRYDQ